MKGKPVVSAFGGLSAAARAIGVPVTTVQHWRDKDSIPHWRHEQVRKAANAQGVALPADDDPADARSEATMRDHDGEPQPIQRHQPRGGNRACKRATREV